MPNSRGSAISAYSAPFSKGAKIYGDNIQSGVITSAHIANGTIVAADVAAGSITSAKIGTGAVLATALGAGSVTSAKIGTGAVTSVKLLAASVISAKIGAGAVLAAALGAGSVISAKIGALAVKAASIAAGAVTSAKINCAFLSGTLVSGKTTRAIAHGLGVRPKFVTVHALPTLAQAISATKIDVFLAAASAATSTNFYVIGTQPANAAVKYVAYVQL